MNFPTEFELDLLFPDEYTDFIAEISYRGQYICLVSQEHGFDNLEIELSGKFLKGDLSFPLSDFLDAITFAKKRLWELRKTDE